MRCLSGLGLIMLALILLGCGAVSATPQPGPRASATGTSHAPTAAAAPTLPTVAVAPSPFPTRPISAVATAANRPQPPGPIYWGAYVSGVPWDMALQDSFEANIGKSASIIHWAQPWWRDNAYQPFYAGDFERVRQRGSLPLIDWGSWDYCCEDNQDAFSLARIVAGDHDAYIRAWAAGARAWGHPLFLRFDWEMNGWWKFPWSERLNGNRPGDYARAWRHVHDIFMAEGATNVTWVWCPNVIGPNTAPLDGLYPGDAYVDWLGIGGYNWGLAYNNTWQSFAQVYGPTYDALQRLAPHKPIMLAEFASGETGGSKAAWIDDAFTTQIPRRFPLIRAVVWFNWNDDDPVLTWPIESSPAAIAAFRRAVGDSPYYLPAHRSPPPRGPIPPPP